MRRNRHQPLPDLGPMAHAVLGAVLERLRRRGPPAVDDAAAPDATAAVGRARERPPYRDAPRARVVAHQLRLHGSRRDAARQRGVAVPHRGGRLHAARRARARGLPPRRGRGGDQVRAAARAGDGGRSPARPDARTSSRSARAWSSTARRRFSPASSSRATARRSTPRSRRRGAPALLLSHYAGRLEYHAPCHLDREVSHLFRGSVDADEANALLAAEGHAGLRLVDNGEIAPGHAHLPPHPGRRLQGPRRGRAHARAWLRARGVHRRGRLARGPGGGRGGRAPVPGGRTPWSGTRPRSATWSAQKRQ